jgi:hypothetical protein
MMANLPELNAFLDTPHLLALAAALGWASGFRLYAALFITGAAGYLGWIPLPQGLHLLQHPAMLAASGFMFAVEFFADKIPFVDSVWDVVHTAIRIPAGAALAAGALGADSGTMSAVAALIGGTLAATAHATKLTTRAAVNASPEPLTNVAVSLFEDGLVMGTLWLASNYPLAFAAALAAALLLSALLVISLLRFFKAVLAGLGRFFVGTPAV